DWLGVSVSRKQHWPELPAGARKLSHRRAARLHWLPDDRHRREPPCTTAPPGARRPQPGAVSLVFDHPDDPPVYSRDLAVRQHHGLESAALAASDRLGPFRVGVGVDAVRAGGGPGAARRRCDDRTTGSGPPRHLHLL